MAKVYTMEELERARKKAQIREWFQDKKVKAQTWCYEHKEQIITYGPVVVGGIAAGAKMLSKHAALAKEQNLKDLLSRASPQRLSFRSIRSRRQKLIAPLMRMAPGLH